MYSCVVLYYDFRCFNSFSDSDSANPGSNPGLPAKFSEGFAAFAAAPSLLCYHCHVPLSCSIADCRPADIVAQMVSEIVAGGAREITQNPMRNGIGSPTMSRSA